MCRISRHRYAHVPAPRVDSTITAAFSAMLAISVAAAFDDAGPALPIVQQWNPPSIMRSYASRRCMPRLAMQRCRSMQRWNGVHMHDRRTCLPRVIIQLAAFISARLTATLASAISAAVAAAIPACIACSTAADFAAASAS